MLIVALLFMASNAVNAETSDGNLGLHFKAQTVDRDHRTSLVLDGERLERLPKKGFSLEYDVKLRKEEYYYGYISRIMLRDDLVLDIISNIEDSRINIVLTNGSHITNSEIVDTSLVSGRWFHVSMAFSRKNIKVTFAGIEKEFEIPAGYYRCPRFSWGVCTYSEILSTDVAPMSVRNVRIYNLSGRKILYDWPLYTHCGDITYDSVNGAEAVSRNGIWEIDSYVNWEKLRSVIVRDINPQLAYDDSSALWYISADTLLYSYDAITDRLTMDRVSGYPYSGVSSQILYDRKNRRLVSYTVESDILRTYDFGNRTWTGKYPHVCFTCQHHNRWIDYSGNKLLSFGGYGTYVFNSSLRAASLYGDVTGWSECRLDSLIYPRYLAAMGPLDKCNLLILGGYGSKSGAQEEYPHNYYDLYKLNIESRQVEKIWNIGNSEDQYVMGNTLIADTLRNCVFALTYDNSRYKTEILLRRFDLFADKPEVEVISSPIPYNFYDIRSFCDLFYHKESSMLYASVVNKNDEGETEISFYRLKYPEYDNVSITSADISSEGNTRLWIYIISVLGGLAVIAFIYALWRRRYRDVSARIDSRLVHEDSGLSGHVSEDKPAIMQKPLQYSICLLGGFQAYDREGNNFTGEFTPTLRNLFLFLLLNSVNDGRGVTSQQLDETFWNDMDKAKATNNRNVNIRKLRLLLARLEDIVLVKQGMYWKFEFGDGFSCDYVSAISGLISVKDGHAGDVAFLLKLTRLASSGKLLPNIEQEWVDRYKSYYSTLLMETMLDLSRDENLQKDNSLMLEISDVMLISDNIDEEGIRIKCRTLYRMGKKGLAKQIFEKYCEDYRAIMNTEPDMTYAETIR